MVYLSVCVSLSLVGVYPLDYMTKFLYVFRIPYKRATCPTHFMIPGQKCG